MRVVIDWQASSFFGWGVYGLNLALEWAGSDIELATTWPMVPRDIQVDALRKRALRPFMQRSALAAADRAPEDAHRLWTLGNGVESLSTPPDGDVGVIFFEQPLDTAAIERAKRYKLIITGSSWNEEILRDAGLDNVRTILQGVDPTLFHPASRRGLFKDRFLIFSGGKAEPRKGQDIVVKAFRILAERYDDVMLVTAWHSPWPQLAAGMDLDLSAYAGRVIDVGAVPNALMPQVYRECDVAVFPNRAEGGTNLVAMEAIACGVPTLLSDNTGHLDLLERELATPLAQRRVTIDGRGETDPQELAEAILRVRHCGARQLARPFDLTWSRTAAALKTTLEELYG